MKRRGIVQRSSSFPNVICRLLMPRNGEVVADLGSLPHLASLLAKRSPWIRSKWSLPHRYSQDVRKRLRGKQGLRIVNFFDSLPTTAWSLVCAQVSAPKFRDEGVKRHLPLTGPSPVLAVIRIADRGVRTS
jgi:hypothetical protein